MDTITQKKKGCCDFLSENDKKLNFDEIAYCPRYLSSDEIRILLDYLGCSLQEFGADLQSFVLNYPDLNWRDYFYSYGRDLHRVLRNSKRRLKLRRYEETLVD